VLNQNFIVRIKHVTFVQ